MGPLVAKRLDSRMDEKFSHENAIVLVKSQLKTLYSDMSKLDVAFNNVCHLMHTYNVKLSDDDYIRASIEQYLLYIS